MPRYAPQSIPRSQLVLIYDFIAESIDDRGYPPTVRECADFLTEHIKKTEGNPWPGWSISTSVMNYTLTRMEQLSMIERDPVVTRAIRLLAPEYWKDDPRW